MKKIKIVMTIVCVMVMALGMASSAGALLITPATMPQMTGNQNNTNDIESFLVGAIPGFNPDQLYEQSTGEVQGIDITADVENALYLLVKDGAQIPAWYLFYLTNIDGVAWNGTDTLELRNFWVGQGAISHVSIYGTTSVPEPMTLLLLGFGLIGLAGFRRK